MLSFILFIYLVAFLYSPKFVGGIWLLGLSVAVFPFFVRRIKGREFLILAGILGVAIIATVIAMLRFDEAFPEYVKTLLIYSASLFSGYTAYLLITSMTRRQVRNSCLSFILLFVGLAAMEVAIPQVRQISQWSSTRFYQDNESVVDRTVDRDIEDHGAPRPLLGVQEPSWSGIALGVAFVGLSLTRVGAKHGSFFILLFITAAILRSPSFLLVVLGGTLLQTVTAVRYRPQLLLSGAILCALGACWIVFFMPSRVQKLIANEDTSTRERITLPLTFTKISLRETNGMGLGFVGAPAEPGNPALEQFFPIVVEAVQTSRTEHLLYYYERENAIIPISHSAILTHWFMHGLLFGTIALYLWTRFVKGIYLNMTWIFLGTMATWGLVGNAYAGIRFWVGLMMMIGFSYHYHQSLLEETYHEEFADTDAD